MHVVITGTSSGLGLELARCFLSAGHRVCGLARSPVRSLAGAYRHFQADLGQAQAVRAAAEGLEGEPVDLIVHNAGLSGSGRRIAEVDGQEVQELLDVNLFGVLNVVQAFLPLLRKGATKRMVLISSRFGSLAYNREPGNRGLKISYSYRISKAAQNMLAVCLANELEPEGISVEVLHPGSFQGGCGRADATETPAEAAIRVFRHIVSGGSGEMTLHDTAGRSFGW